MHTEDWVYISQDDLDLMLRFSNDNVLSLELLGIGFEDAGEVTLNVPVSELDASDFIV